MINNITLFNPTETHRKTCELEVTDTRRITRRFKKRTSKHGGLIFWHNFIFGLNPVIIVLNNKGYGTERHNA
jgi:hypothetical protein